MKIHLLVVVVLTITNFSVFAETNSASTSSTIGTEGREITREEFLAKFGGIGIAIAPSADGVLVKKVFPDTPACAAGMKVGDIVTQIDSKSTKGLKVQEVMDRIRGSVGTEVDLIVSRQGATEPIKLKLVRRVLSVPKGEVSCE